MFGRTSHIVKRVLHRVYSTTRPNGLNTNVIKRIAKKPYVNEMYLDDYKVLRILTVGINPMDLIDPAQHIGHNFPWLDGREAQQVIDFVREEKVNTHPIFSRMHFQTFDFLYYPQVNDPLLGYAIATRCKGKSDWSTPLSLGTSWFSDNPYKHTWIGYTADKPHFAIVNRSVKNNHNFAEVPVLLCSEHPSKEELEELNETIEDLITLQIVEQQREDAYDSGMKIGLAGGLAAASIIRPK